MPRKPTRLDYEYGKTMVRWDTIRSLGTTAIFCGTGVVALFFVKQVFEALAGKTTFAEIGFKFLADLRTTEGVVRGVLAILGFGGIGYGYSQRQLRRRHIETSGDHIRKLEEALDAKRSSSKLTRRGTTPPGDKR